MITATPKTGFLIEDAGDMSKIVSYLRDYASLRMNGYHVRALADRLFELPARRYYEPVQQQLIEEIDVVEVQK